MARATGRARVKKRKAKRRVPITEELSHEAIIAAAEFKGKKRRAPRIPAVAKRKQPKKPPQQITTTVKGRELEIISRKGQPRPSVIVEVLERKSYLRSVSSSWLSTIGILYSGETGNVGTFTTQTGRQYKISNFPFSVFEEWYYAHSKGTFWNEKIRDNYTITGTL